MSKNRFVSDELILINLSDDDWIKVKKELSFEEYYDLFLGIDVDKKEESLKVAIPLLKYIVKEWNFVNDKGEVLPCNDINIEKLSAGTIFEILPKVTELYSPEKKS